MGLRITIHKTMAVVDPNGRVLSILGPQIGGMDVNIGAVVANSFPAGQPCVAHFKADADCFIAIGEADAATTNIANSFPLDAGERDTRLLNEGDIISVIAA